MSDDPTPSPAITRLRQQRELQRKGLQEPESSGLTGFAAIKYAAIVIIVLAVLSFIAWYVIPAFNN